MSFINNDHSYNIRSWIHEIKLDKNLDPDNKMEAHDHVI